jgi:2'-5' RNA ligase
LTDPVLAETKTSLNSLRLFLAIPIPDAIKAEVARAQSDLRQAVPNARITWTRPEQFHLTLRFLGNVNVAAVETLGAALAPACKGCVPLHMQARGMGCFPHARRPRVIWAGLQDVEQRLTALQTAIQNATHEFTTESKEKQFSGHVTLGRIKAIGAKEKVALSGAIARKAGNVWGEWTAANVELIRSELSDQGARYTRLLEVKLGAIA